MTGKIMYGVLVAVFLMAASSVFAQEQAPSADAIVAKMQSQLNLSQEQVNSIKPIIEDNLSKRQALKQSMQGADKSEMRSQMQQLRDEENQKLSEILSADQMSQWQNMQNKMRQGHKHNHGGTEGASASGG